MSSIKQAEMKANLQRDEKTATTLSKSFQTLLKVEKTADEAQKQLGNSLNTISENEATANLKKLFADVSTSLITVSLSHQKYVQNLEQKILPSTASYNNEIKSLKTQLTDYEKKYKTEQTAETSLSSQKNQGDSSKAQQLQKKHEDARRETEKSQMTLVNKLRNYAAERNLELKSMLQHFVHAQMQYHASALENLTVISQRIQKFDEEKESNDLLEKLIMKNEMEIKK